MVAISKQTECSNKPKWKISGHSVNVSEFGFVCQVNEIWFAVAYVDVTSFKEVFVIVVIVAAATDTAEPKIIMKREKS